MKMNLPEERFKSWIPFGFEFLGPSDAEALLNTQHRIRREFKNRAYQEVIPPALDFEATFRLAHGPMDDSFQTRDRMGEALALRSDLTVQVIKAAASGAFGPSGSFSYLQSVFVDHPFGSGRPRQTMQAGVEFVGSRANRLQELIDLSACIVPAARLLYGDMRFLRQLVPASEPAILRFIDRKDQAGLAELLKTSNLPPGAARILLELPFMSGATLADYRALCKAEAGLLAVLDEAPTSARLVYDFGLVRDLAYYTGPVFQGYIDGEHEPVLSGGVYDDLFERFSGKRCEAAGMAFNVSVLARHEPKIEEEL